MPIEYKKKVACLRGVVAVEEAEELMTWLNDTPGGRVNLKDCEHLHTAVLQVLLALRPALSARPREGFLDRWVRPRLETPGPAPAQEHTPAAAVEDEQELTAVSRRAVG